MRRIAALLLLLFLADAALALGGFTAGLDRSALAALRLPGLPGVADVPRRAVRAAILITAFGAGRVRAAVAIAAASLLAIRRRWTAAAVLVLAWAGESLLVEAVKPLAGRARPPLAFHLVAVRETSFPSGHAAGAMLLYPLAGALLARRGGAGAGIAFALAIGLTRVLLGVHWASDVAGGWLLGGAIAAFALSCRPMLRTRA